MKTSNKILLFIGLILLILPFINAYSLRQKIINKEYTLLKDRNVSQFESVALVPTDSIHIIGANDLKVEIIQSDSVSVEKEQNSNVYIFEDNGVLTIKYSKKDNINSKSPGLVKIKTPSLKAVSFQGKLIVDSVGNKYRNTVTKYYSSFEVTIKSFKNNQMNIHGLNGGGTISLNNSQIENLSLNLGEKSNFKIDDKSRINSMKAKAAKNTGIIFKGTHVDLLETNLDTSAALTIMGSNVGDIIPYK